MLNFLIILLAISAKFTESADENPCDDLEEGQKFVPNPRGCATYFYCNEGVATPQSCKPGYHFFSTNSSCELPETVGCEIDEKLWVKKCPGQGIAKIPHPYSCSDYSVCLDDVPQDRSCPAGLHFSPFDNDCVHPDLVNCQTETSTCSNTKNFVPKFISSSRSCQVYHMCFNNKLQTFSCDNGQEFDSKSSRCVPAGESDCDKTSIPAHIVDIPDKLTIDCDSAVQNSRVAHPDSCSFWFWCVNGQSQIFWCGKDSLFDSVSRTCTGKEHAKCANVKKEPEESTDSTTEENEPEESTEGETEVEGGTDNGNQETNPESGTQARFSQVDRHDNRFQLSDMN